MGCFSSTHKDGVCLFICFLNLYYLFFIKNIYSEVKKNQNI